MSCVGRTLEHFFSHMSPNNTGSYEEEFPFLSRRMHERYYTRRCYDGDTPEVEAPFVFNDYTDEGYVVGCACVGSLFLFLNKYI